MRTLRRRAGWLAAPLVIAGLLLLPHEGAASGPWKLQEPVNPWYLGDPDTPPNLHRSDIRVGSWTLLPVQLPNGSYLLIPKWIGTGKRLFSGTAKMQRKTHR
jgi:hypothetical protein